MTLQTNVANPAPALRAAGFTGEVETDLALRNAMSTDNSVYRILPDLIVAPRSAQDLVVLMQVMERPEFAQMGLTARGGGTGTNGQSINRGVIVDMRRHMNRLLAVDTDAGWAEVEPGIVLDDLNAQLRPTGWFFAPETSTSTRCTVGGMVSTDASGKGSRIYGKTSDNLLGVELARAEGVLTSWSDTPNWAAPMLAQAEAAARAGRAAFIANTPRLNRRYTGYDLERACPPDADFAWWRLLPGSEGTLGLMTRIRLKLRRIEAEKRLLVVGFDSFRKALASATPLLAVDPTAIEVMDEWVQQIAQDAGILDRLPPALRAQTGQQIAYVFIEFNGDDAEVLEQRIADCVACVQTLPGVGAVYQAQDLDEIRALWAIRSAGVGLLAKVDGPVRPVAFVEDCVVPPENLPAFLDDFQAVLTDQGLGFGIYGHVDVGCLHVRPALNIDALADRQKLVAVSDAVFALTRKYGGIFWGEHGKGVRGAYLRDWIGEDAYGALRAVKAAFDPNGRFNPGKLITLDDRIYGIADTPFRPFNTAEDDPLLKAFRCNGNAQCLSYAASTPMCPSFKATADARYSPKGRADALRAWHQARGQGEDVGALERDMLPVLDACLGCKACASSCPVQVDVPHMRAAFYEDYFKRHARPMRDRVMLLAERFSPLLSALSPALRPVWPVAVTVSERVFGMVDLPRHLAPRVDKALRFDPDHPASLPENAVILVGDWFSALLDGAIVADAVAGFAALGYAPRVMTMRPAGKMAQTLGDRDGFLRMARGLAAALTAAQATDRPLIGLDPAFVMQLRQDYPKAGVKIPNVLSPQEFLLRESKMGKVWPKASPSSSARVFGHCTETTAAPMAATQWRQVFAALGMSVDTPATGCCGMAGTFGHQARHQTLSRKLFDLSWAKPVAGDGPVYATGFSCRCQIERLSDKQDVRHPMGLIADTFAPADRAA